MGLKDILRSVHPFVFLLNLARHDTSCVLLTGGVGAGEGGGGSRECQKTRSERIQGAGTDQQDVIRIQKVARGLANAFLFVDRFFTILSTNLTHKNQVELVTRLF